MPIFVNITNLCHTIVCHMAPVLKYIKEVGLVRG